jgi:NAD(P)H-hydrate epimerase
MTAPPIYRGEIPYLTTEQMLEVDRAMIEDFGIELVQMMENAGRALAHLARARFLAGDPIDRHVTIIAGTGGNGGGALVCARRLHGWGARVKVLLTKPERSFAPVPANQLRILSQMHLEVNEPDIPIGGPSPDLIIDGVIGYSLRDAPTGMAGELIRWANAQSSPILALDVPSGVDATTGTVFDPAIAATATMTLALPKEGLRAPGVEAQVGELYLADISVPPSLYARPPLGLRVGHIFSQSDIVRLP